MEATRGIARGGGGWVVRECGEEDERQRRRTRPQEETRGSTKTKTGISNGLSLHDNDEEEEGMMRATRKWLLAFLDFFVFLSNATPPLLGVNFEWFIFQELMVLPRRWLQSVVCICDMT